MFQRAFIEQLANRKFGREETLVREECERLGIEVVPYFAKRLMRGQLPLSQDTFICGDITAMHRAMKQLSIEIPILNDFPDSLQPWFRRRIWSSSIAGLERMVESGAEVFAKPAGRRKVFTGRVFSTPDDMLHVLGISRQEPLWCAEPVKWETEYRVYVVEGKIVAIRHYSGEPALKLCMDTLHNALAAFTSSGEAPAGYAIDFGVLDTGETALVEANDGYSVGAYAIDAEPYTKMLFTRWAQLLGR